MLDGLTTGVSAQGMMWPGGFGRMLDPKQSARGQQPRLRRRPPKPRCSAAGRSASTTTRRTRKRRPCGRRSSLPPRLRSRARRRRASRCSAIRNWSRLHPQYPAVLAGAQRHARPVPERAAVGPGRRLSLRRAERRDQRRQVRRGGDGRPAEPGRTSSSSSLNIRTVAWASHRSLSHGAAPAPWDSKSADHRRTADAPSPRPPHVSATRARAHFSFPRVWRPCSSLPCRSPSRPISASPAG